MHIRLSIIIAIILSVVAGASAQSTRIKWFGHAAFSITTPKGKVLLIDPWLSNPKNPEAASGKDPLASLGRVDYILLTHGHRDHVGEAAAVARKTGAALIATPELARNLIKLTDFPEKNASDTIMGIGGEMKIADGEVTVAMTAAVHTSSVFNAKAGPNEAERANGGSPTGFVIMISGGPTIYHTGDTAYFRDMETIGEQYSIDVALVGIGGHTSMEPNMSARAAKSVRAKLAIPQHFGTDEGMTQDTLVFSAELRRLKIPFYEMKPGETLTFDGKTLRAAQGSSGVLVKHSP
jgi:L-ascorbate metabolism protein UlaG (beta-lactamase superfamily)